MTYDEFKSKTDGDLLSTINRLEEDVCKIDYSSFLKELGSADFVLNKDNLWIDVIIKNEQYSKRIGQISIFDAEYIEERLRKLLSKHNIKECPMPKNPKKWIENKEKEMFKRYNEDWSGLQEGI